MKQNYLTIGFIFLGVLFAGFNFYIFNAMTHGGLQFDLSKISGITQTNAKAQAVLPDIKPGESYTKSNLRTNEVDKTKSNLPYDSNLFRIDYSEQSKYLTITVKATTLEKYRENKFLAEEKLLDLGATNICLLEVVWNVPIALKDQITQPDLSTRGCSS
jgi:hypothetical protein